jgi:hypothetical protein
MLAVAACLAGASSAAAADDDAFAPVDRPGPALTVPQPDLRASFACTDDAATAQHAPVLLVAATTVNTQENYAWNWIPALRAAGFPVCTSDLPGDADQNMEDMQTRAEYLVFAIRRAYKLGGRRRISIYGHSQGGQIMRWPLRFWPDTRPLVEDVIGAAPTNHGSIVVGPAICTPNCAPALWQQRDTADWYRALNSHQETFAGIDYTEIYSHTDEFVQPNLDDTGTSSLRTGDGRITNVALQDLCPTDVSEHLLIGTADSVTWALGLDALTHAGPADPGRVSPDVCAQPFMPGVEASTFVGDFAATDAVVATQLALAPRAEREPALRCYVFASCASVAPTAPAACAARSRVVRLARSVVRVRRGKAKLRIRTSAAGRRTVRVRFRGTRGTVKLRITRRAPNGRTHRTVRTVRRCPR